MHRVLAHEAEEAVLAAHVVRLLEEDTHIVVALLETLGAELATLQRRLFPPAHLARALAAHPPSLCLFPLRCRVTAFFSRSFAHKKVNKTEQGQDPAVLAANPISRCQLRTEGRPREGRMRAADGAWR